MIGLIASVLAAIRIVCPSAEDLAAISMPIIWPAPGRLSTTNCAPSDSESFCASARAMMSVPPPAAEGTMKRTGFGQMIGVEMAARSSADGHTILMAASTLAINPIMYKKVPYDPLRDFAPITQAASLANVLVVHPSLPVKSVADLIAYAKQRPGQLNFASAGVGTSPQMSIELLKIMAGIDMVHIPYKGTSPGVVD